MTRPTLKSIAKQLGISHATVSMALRDNPLINTHTREQVKQAAAELRYVPNGIAQAMRYSQASTLGVIVGEIGNSFTSMIIGAIENEAQKHGYQCLICQAHESVISLEQEIHMLARHRSAGLIIQALDFENQADVYNRALLPIVPCVFCDGEVPNYPSSSVLSDNRYLGYLATQHLIELGHHRIACILGPDRNAQERFQGYRRAMAKAFLPVDDNLIIVGGWGFEEGARTARELLKRGSHFTAVVASSDPVAVGAIKVLVAARLRVPEDVSIIGAGNHDFTCLITPTLTSIEQYPGKIGQQAMATLLERITDPSSPFRRRAIKPRLIIRESTAPREG